MEAKRNLLEQGCQLVGGVFLSNSPAFLGKSSGVDWELLI